MVPWQMKLNTLHMCKVSPHYDFYYVFLKILQHWK